ncbi:PLP-dependent aminotransferase family protein [Nonomuraea sp. NPDC050022]|uniref:MocR-like pyridoxine biosynthesis transcription factor PdxR n=1 Tax=Nonomuraea sp. NPDC050022 TaxID=3364358 RepID=UPI0037B3D3BE
MPKQSPSLAAAGITLAPAPGIALSRHLYERIRDAILSGQLRPGLRLPSSRALAAELGVSRTTTVTAYERLRDEGYLDGRVGAGTTVALLRIPHPAAAPVHEPPNVRQPPRLSAQGAALAGVRWRMRHTMDGPGSGPPAFPVGRPAIDAFPAELWGKVVARRARRSAGSLLRYQHPAGYQPLREAIAAYVGMARAVRCTPEQVLVVGGAQAGLSLAARLLLDPGDDAWMEDPGYYGARGAIIAAGATPVPVPVDADGLDIDAGNARAPHARIAYVTPSHQFPLGVTMSLHRRLALLDWARTAGTYVLEDDYDSEYRYIGDPLPSLQGLDGAGRVVYVGSFSKVLFPALRIGYLIVPDELVDAFTAGQRFAAAHVPVLEQAALTDFIADGHFARHVRRMRALYAERGAALVRAARQELDGVLSVTPADAGLHVVGWLPEDIDDREAAFRAAAYGVDVQPLSAHAQEPAKRPGLLLGHAATPEPHIVTAIHRLAASLTASAQSARGRRAGRGADGDPQPSYRTMAPVTRSRRSAHFEREA